MREGDETIFSISPNAASTASDGPAIRHGDAHLTQESIRRILRRSLAQRGLPMAGRHLLPKTHP